jgi:hypothetical protein
VTMTTIRHFNRIALALLAITGRVAMLGIPPLDRGRRQLLHHLTLQSVIFFTWSHSNDIIAIHKRMYRFGCCYITKQNMAPNVVHDNDSRKTGPFVI